MKIWISAMKTSEFGKVSVQGIHLKEPTAAELVNALDQAVKDGFKNIYVYDSQKDAVALSAMLATESDIYVGWSDFCQTVDAFVVDIAV